jgi:prepilin-type processing-associated H-X9-DG protein
VTCLSNLKQLSQTAFMYHQDYGKGVPGHFEDAFWVRIFSDFHPPVRSVFLCPVAKELQADGERDLAVAMARDGTAANSWWWKTRSGTDEWTGSYAMNGFLFTAKFLDPGSAQFHFPTFASVERPAATALLVDGVLPVVWVPTNRPTSVNLFAGNSFYYLIGRHGSKPPTSVPRFWPLDQPLPRMWAINAGFADGHVETVKLRDLDQLTWRRAYQGPTKPNRP